MIIKNENNTLVLHLPDNEIWRMYIKKDDDYKFKVIIETAITGKFIVEEFYSEAEAKRFIEKNVTQM